MNAQQIQQAAALAISQMDDAEKAAFIQMFEAGEHHVTQAMSVGYACQAIHNHQILASKALDQIEAFSEIVYDYL